MDKRDKFELVINILKEILDKNQGIIHVNDTNNIQFIFNEEFFIENKSFKDVSIKEFKNIIENQVKKLMITILSDEEQELIDFISSQVYKNGEKKDEEEKNQYIEDTNVKIKLLKKLIITNNLIRDFNFKKNNSNNSFSSLEWSIHKKIFDSITGENDIGKLAYINLKINDKNDNLRVPQFLAQAFKLDQVKNVNFICNKDDLDYLIKILNNIKIELERR